MKPRDQYLKLVRWSEEDGCYIGSVPGWIGDCCRGNNEEEVYAELCRIVDEWIRISRKDKRPLPPPTNRSYSGKFVLRTGPDLHRALALRALGQGESLNTHVMKTLRESLKK